MAQTSIEWLVQEIGKFNNGQPTEAMIMYAKKLHKKELGNAWDAALIENSKRGGNEVRTFDYFDDYYDETYGNKGSTVAKRLKEEMPKHIADEVDAYAEKIAHLEKFIIEETLKNYHIVDTNKMISSKINTWDDIFDNIESEMDCVVPLKVANYLEKHYRKPTPLQTDENGKPLTYWGGLDKKPQTLTSLWGLMKDRTCTNSCSVVCGECQILNISEDCEEVKNWDSFVEQKNKELYYQKQIMNPYSSDSQSYTAYEKGFIEGFEKAKETLYTEEQMVQAIKSFITYKAVSDRDVWDKDIYLYIQSLKRD